MVKKNMNEGQKGVEKNQRKNIRTLQAFVDIGNFWAIGKYTSLRLA